MPQVRLTQRFVKGAKCPANQRKVDFFDLASPGFLLEVRKGGKTFYQRYSDLRGDQRQFRIGSADVLTLTQAKAKARDVLIKIEIGTDPHAERAALRSIPRFRDFASETYLPFARGNKRSWKTDETMLRIHLLPDLGSHYMDEVRPQDINSVLDKLRDAEYAPGTVGRALILLRHMFNLGRRWKTPGVAENPTDGFVVPPDVQRSRYLTKDEAARLIASIRADQNQLAAKAIMLLLLTGARRNEITHARWDYVDWNSRTLLVPLSKSGKPRAITLSGAAVDLLRSIERVDGNQYIVPAPTTGRPSPHLFFPWDRIRKRAGLSDLRLHDLRHSFASFLVNEGVSLYKVQMLLGHAHSRSTARYSHLAPETLAETAELVAGLLQGL